MVAYCVSGTALDTSMMTVVVVAGAAIAVTYWSMIGHALHVYEPVTYILPLTATEV